jgi:hypothetical protein
VLPLAIGAQGQDKKGKKFEIPKDAIVELWGAVAPSGLITILWQGHVFSAFFEDLNERAVIIET